ncbi:stage V sporulation protein AB [Paenibacillus macquariensis]|uniref:Stage V sporulation protein AB n=1 Tax=Paenibacillus macquariensis TaxID=948756 RepID=A0ABY1JJY2_9BACL|nr:stage V sporulation protein AB [Paenibacillus macquariensis]MEC0089822.1 stage V sporulation protein AB [Paenibacillus macquariensis]OAB30711.1 stage V sporulation protein AB [Paenibacillus macquariensis subsp. macquariensis]SIQ31955.1 stage V sporulation protein AB [Paenibacillus macquariensis]
MTILTWLIEILLGVAGGIAVGSGVIAFILVLDIIPRLAQLTHSYHKVHWYEGALIVGSLVGTVSDFWNWKGSFNPLVGLIIGLFFGVFVGLLAAALTEVLNVLPILAKRLHMRNYLLGLLMAMIVGKVAGSLFDWYVFRR